MKKLNYKVLLIMVTLFIIILPNFFFSSKVSVDQVSKAWVKYTTTSKVKVKWKKVKNATGYRVYVYNYSKNKYQNYATTSNNYIKMRNLKSAQKYNIISELSCFCHLFFVPLCPFKTHLLLFFNI